MKLAKMSATISASISPETKINLSYLGSCHVWDPKYLVGLRFAVSRCELNK